MSSNAFEPPLRIEPRASGRARILLFSLYGLAGAGLVAVVSLLFALPILIAGVLLFALEWHRTKPVGLLEWAGDGDWWVEAYGPWELRPATVVTPWLVVLVLTDGARTLRVPLLPDSLHAAQWRRLRARLRRHPVEA